MKLCEVLKNCKLRGYTIYFKDLYGNEYKKDDFYANELLKIEELEVRNVNINFRLEESTFYLIGLYELLKEGF